jgi:preprotein translocase subunit SecG
MNWLWNVLVVVQIVVALVMIGLILMQHGKGADMGATFGSGASGSLFGASGSANFMSRSTAVCAGLFFACTLALTHLSTAKLRPGSGGSVLDKPAISASAPLSGAALVPAAPVRAASATTTASAPAAVTATPAASAISVSASAPSVAASAAVSTPAFAPAKAATASSVPQK